MRHIGVKDGVAYVTQDVARGASVSIGNLVTSTDPSVRISVTKWSPEGATVIVHNPSDRSIIRTELRGMEGFPGLAGWRRAIKLSPGTQGRSFARPLNRRILFILEPEHGIIEREFSGEAHARRS
jgi:hypothetical protein